MNKKFSLVENTFTAMNDESFSQNENTNYATYRFHFTLET